MSAGLVFAIRFIAHSSVLPTFQCQLCLDVGSGVRNSRAVRVQGEGIRANLVRFDRFSTLYRLLLSRLSTAFIAQWQCVSLVMTRSSVRSTLKAYLFVLVVSSLYGALTHVLLRLSVQQNPISLCQQLVLQQPIHNFCRS